MEAVLAAIALAYAYLVGAIPTAYIVGRMARGIDIRRYGSGNVGASNVAQHLGVGYLVAVGVFDVAVKGAGAVLVARLLGLGLGYQAVAALLAAVGHNWSPYLGFTGGRGVAVTIGALAALSWPLCLALLGVALAGGRLFRSNALWFAIAAALLPAWAVALGEPWTVFWYTLGATLVGALKRLLSNPGTALPGLRWRDVALPRLLHDRDTWKAEDWVSRTPADEEAKEG